MVQFTEKTIAIAVGVLVVAFVVWSQNLVDNSVLILLAGVGLLAAALIGNVEDAAHEGHHDSLQDNSDFGEHPESYEEEAHGSPAGH